MILADLYPMPACAASGKVIGYGVHIYIYTVSARKKCNTQEIDVNILAYWKKIYHSLNSFPLVKMS